jgi:UDP-N-acetylmuramoyl-tripeptide--D-alanyl-D-alanine ligase
MKFESFQLLAALRSVLTESLCLSDPAPFEIQTDSRALKGGDFFWPLRGDVFDGHDFLAEALSKGCVGFVFSRPLEASLVTLVKTKKILALRVQDTLSALQILATWIREKVNPFVIAITGSNGKTTTKDLLGQILERVGQTVYSKKSFNNHVGVPLTLLSLEKETQFAVLEMGMNHPGEIRNLVEIAKPDLGVVVNVSGAHLGNFSSFEALVAAKAEMVTTLKKDAILVLNANLKRFESFRNGSRARKLWEFGFEESGVFCSWGDVEQRENTLKIPLLIEGKTQIFEMPMIGKHLAEDVACAVTCCFVLGIPVSSIQEGVRNFKSSGMRMELCLLRGGIRLVNDAYNANPVSAAAAIGTLDAWKGFGEKYLVLGNMEELGSYAEEAHEYLGEVLVKTSIDGVFTLGTWAKRTGVCVEERSSKEVRHFEDKETMLRFLNQKLKPGDTLLLKGSRANKLEIVAEGLQKFFGVEINV